MSVPRVVIRDLGNRGEKEELRRIFSKYGALTNVWVADDPPGFAYIFFEHFRDAEDAVENTNESRICGMRVRVELSPIEDRRAQQGGYRGRGRGDYNRFSSGSRGRSGAISRPSYDSRDSSGGGSRGGRYSSSYRDQSRSSYGSYSSDRDRDRSDYSRGRGRGGRGRGDYRSSSPSGRGGYGRGRGGGQYGYSSGGSHSGGSGNYSSNYSSGYSGSSSSGSYGYQRGSRGGYRGGSSGNREGGGYRSDYSGGDYNQNYRSQGQKGGGSYSSYRGRGRGGQQHSGDYDSRQRRDTRSDHIRAREREYQSEYGYGSSRNTGGDYEYREHRSKNRSDDYSGGGDQYSSSHRDEYKKYKRDDYRKSSHDDYKEPLKRPSRYRKEDKGYSSSKDYQDEQWESNYRDRSPHRSRYEDERYRESPSHEGSPRKRDDEYLEEGSSYHGFSPRGSYHEHTPGDDAGYEHVDQYDAEEEYHTEDSRPHTPPVYHRSRSYTPESRRVEYGDEATEHSETKRYEDDDPEGEHGRKVREVVEFEGQEESERFVKLDDKRDTHYERDTHRERDRSREKRRRPYPSEETRYSPARKGSSRHRSPSPAPRRRRSVNL